MQNVTSGKALNNSRVLNERRALIEQVLALMHAAGIDVAIDADHEVERQLKFAAHLGQEPEDRLGGSSDELPVPGRGDEIRRQAKWRTPWRPGRRTARTDAAAPIAATRSVADFDAGGLGQALAHFRLVELKHEVVGAQARHVAMDVESFERIVEGVGEKNALEIGSLPDLLLPVRLAKSVGGFVEESSRNRRQ